MIQCQQCGQRNAEQTQFCRFCGNRLLSADSFAQPNQQQENVTYAPPRPYAWKTDEYQTQSESRVKPSPSTQPINQGGLAYPASQPMFYTGPQFLATNYRCPNCGTTVPPTIERRISTAGWITFALLLVFTVIFFWIGLLMKQDYSVCPVCRATLN